MSSNEKLPPRKLAWKCGRCAELCSTVLGWPGCQKWLDDGKAPEPQLCQLLDDATLKHAEPRAFQTLKGIDEAVRLRVVFAHQAIGSSQVPVDAPQFLQWLLDWHFFIFQPITNIAGQFRTAPGTFGGHVGSRHYREGSAPDQVEVDLKQQVFGELQRSLAKSEPIDLTLARFLQRFFEVHPFPDGNGRVARLFCDCLAAEHRLQFVWTPDAEDEYTRGLEVAHNARASDSVHAPDPVDPERLDSLDQLRQVIRGMLAPVSRDLTEEEP